MKLDIYKDFMFQMLHFRLEYESRDIGGWRREYRNLGTRLEWRDRDEN